MYLSKELIFRENFDASPQQSEGEKGSLRSIPRRERFCIKLTNGRQASSNFRKKFFKYYSVRPRVYDAESDGACDRKLNWTVRTAGVRVQR